MDDIRPDSSQTLQLLDEVQSGNREALGQLLKRHRPHIETAVACRLDRRVRARLDASDVVQETQIEVMQRNFEGLSNGEVSCLLEIGRDAAKKRYTRAMLRLQELLREDGLSGVE